MGAILQVHLLMDPNVNVISANTFLLICFLEEFKDLEVGH